jgi:putative transposase
MTRLARVIAVDVPHHVTQRGNARRFILDCDADRMAYLNLLRRNIELHGLGLIGYCLMSNHVHLVVTPHNTDGLGLALRHTHGRYAIYWNAVHQSSGHAWQGRYYSCPLDRVHLWEARCAPGWRGRRKRGRGPARQRTADRNRGTRP